MIDATPTWERQHVFNCISIIPHKKAVYQVPQVIPPGMTERAPCRVLETCSVCLITDLEAIWGCYKGYQIHPELRISLTFLSSLLHPWMLRAHLWHCWVYTCWIIHSRGATTVLISRWWQREKRGGKKLFLEVRVSKQLPFGHASRYVLKYHRAACSKQVRQWVEVCWTSIPK